MRYVSSRGGHEADLIEAVMRGLASDGGLFVPQALPHFAPDGFQGEDVGTIAQELLAPFFAGSPLESQLADICREAFDFPIVLEPLLEDGRLAVLELFHGPTAAFKDIGARFLAGVMERALPALPQDDERPVTILVATSGDTGSAVAAAFHGRKGIRVGVLFPKGQVSPRQQHQLTCWGGNVRAFEVHGSFDDCQALVKTAFTDPVMSRRYRLTGANSINIARLLPQCAYHAAASLWHWRAHGTKVGFIVPTGNLGNGVACIWARAMGLPIGDVVLATNANRTIPDFLATGDWQPRPSRPTLASAMDVGNPSNMERLRHLVPGLADLRQAVEAFPVEDDAIRAQIAKDHRRFGRAWCPHTATAFWVYDHLPEQRRASAWIAVATAHPAKFERLVEEVIGARVPVPDALQRLLQLPVSSHPLQPDPAELDRALAQWTVGN